MHNTSWVGLIVHLIISHAFDQFPKLFYISLVVKNQGLSAEGAKSEKYKNSRYVTCKVSKFYFQKVSPFHRMSLKIQIRNNLCSTTSV